MSVETVRSPMLEDDQILTLKERRNLVIILRIRAIFKPRISWDRVCCPYFAYTRSRSDSVTWRCSPAHPGAQTSSLVTSANTSSGVSLGRAKSGEQGSGAVVSGLESPGLVASAIGLFRAPRSPEHCSTRSGGSDSNAAEPKASHRRPTRRQE
jgi:hypothetical protein